MVSVRAEPLAYIMIAFVSHSRAFFFVLAEPRHNNNEKEAVKSKWHVKSQNGIIECSRSLRRVQSKLMNGSFFFPSFFNYFVVIFWLIFICDEENTWTEKSDFNWYSISERACTPHAEPLVSDQQQVTQSIFLTSSRCRRHIPRLTNWIFSLCRKSAAYPYRSSNDGNKR